MKYHNAGKCQIIKTGALLRTKRKKVVKNFQIKLSVGRLYKFSVNILFFGRFLV